MVIVSPISGPSPYSRRGNESAVSETRLMNKQSLATTMPSERQTSRGVGPVEVNREASGDYERWKKSKIFNPRQTSIAITSENFFKAKAGFEPIYMHNIAATKLALMSVMEKERPRYGEQINILA